MTRPGSRFIHSYHTAAGSYHRARRHLPIITAGMTHSLLLCSPLPITSVARLHNATMPHRSFIHADGC
eukprot:scaffold512151_cov28-Prasinocladus_malaysianus.AAC.1